MSVPRDGLPPWACPKRPLDSFGGPMPCSAVEVYDGDDPRAPPSHYRCRYCGREWRAP